MERYETNLEALVGSLGRLSEDQILLTVCVCVCDLSVTL